MNKNYRETKNDLIHCPFNPNHLVKRSRLITHKKLCPDKNNKGIIQCPYNPSHHVLIENLEKHKEKCPDRVIINSDLAKKCGEDRVSLLKDILRECEKYNLSLSGNAVDSESFLFLDSLNDSDIE